jgi:hypothetical protein
MKMKKLLLLLVLVILLASPASAAIKACTACNSSCNTLPGTPSTFLINWTFTGSPGTSALVTNLGNTTDVVLDFTIPTGAAGSQGSQGVQGVNGTPGADGAVGPQGIQGVNGTPGAKGDQGVQGVQGIPGINGTNGIDGINGTQGIQGIPGINGTNGIDGINGTQGIQGIPGINGTNGTNGVNANLGGLDTQVIFNDTGVANGSSCMTFDKISGTLTACNLVGDGSGITGVGSTAATALTFDVKANGNIKKGQAVYISGAVGSNPIVSVADNTDTTKSRVVGLMVADTNHNSQGQVRRSGTLTSVDTRATNANINPLGQTWSAGDLLFATTAGGLTNVRPTSGRSVKVAYNLEAAGVNGVLLAYPMENPVWITGASAEDVITRLGDSIGVNKLSIRNYTNTEVAYVDSQGKASFNGSTMQSKNISAVLDPVAAQDAATKNYVDTKGFITSTYNATYDAKPTFSQVYPVGSIYISVSSTNPSTLFGGTWAAFGTGRVLIGINGTDTDFDTVKEVGGTKTVASAGTNGALTFTGTASYTVVAHTHDITLPYGTTDGTAGVIDSSSAYTKTMTNTTAGVKANGSATYTPQGTINTPSFTGTPTSVVQPYIVVYMWERTA